MVPSAESVASPEPEVKTASPIATLVLEPRITKTSARVCVDSHAAVPIGGDFLKTSLIENNQFKSSSRTVDLLVAFVAHAVLLSIPILAGLYFTDTLNLREFQNTFLVAPPPPPPPPPAPAVTIVKAPPHRVFESSGKLIAPRVIPKNVADIKEAPLPPDMDSGGVPGGVPGGVAGGSMGGVIGGVVGGINTSTLVAPLAPKDNRPKAPVRVGGRIREPKLVYRVDPTYPILARQTHMQGVVIIDAVVDEQGNVVEAKVRSGPPLLIQSAIDALRQWRYEPTYLNDQPVSVQLTVTVSFLLNQ
ncbi:MAG TPA: energy transducer TonB [Candidatus Acidoferrum sp.]|nr:energy transducer TonB [Candidatus Acidoferrum sp.]